MLWAIVKRELADHLMSFRFSAIFVLTLLLMVISILVSSSEYRKAMKEYPTRVEQLVNEDGKVNLGMVAGQGRATVQQVPSYLAFCNGTGERQLPNQVFMAVHGLRGVQRSSDLGEVYRLPGRVDWTFAIAVILSFGAGLLTYRGISGEMSEGTLTLVLSHPVPRSTVLLGKYIAALLALVTVFLIATLCGLVVILSIDPGQLRGDDWLKIGFFCMVGIIYLSCFTSIGLVCSVVARGPLLSAIAYLFVWTAFVFIAPNLGGIVAARLGDAPTPLQMREASAAIKDQISLTPTMGPDEVASAKLRRESAREQLLIGYVQSLTRQVDLGEDLARISPVSVFSSASERIVGGGTFRLKQFLNNALRYREGFLQGMLREDRKDPDSQHRYTPWWVGGKHFSQRVVDIGPQKEFRDPPPTSLEGLGAALWDILLLSLYSMIFFSIALWRFASRDVVPIPGA